MTVSESHPARIASRASQKSLARNGRVCDAGASDSARGSGVDCLGRVRSQSPQDANGTTRTPNGAVRVRSTTHTPTKLLWKDPPKSFPSCTERSASRGQLASTESYCTFGSHPHT